MQNVIFSPSGDSEDVVASTLLKISRNILIFTFGLLPLFVVPVVYAPFGFSKVLFAVAGVFIAIIFFSLATLRSGSFELKKSFIFLVPWIVALSAVLSAVFSGDVRDALIGSNFGVHTAFFVGFIALVITSIPMLARQKNSLMTLYVALSGVALLLGTYHILRLFFGVDFLSFGIFQNSTSTPLGGWNDLAIFFGLSLLLALVTIEQLPLTRVGQWVFIAVSVLALVILGVVNFSAIWFVLGFVSLVVLMYALTKNRFKSGTLPLDNDGAEKTIYSVVLSTTVFAFSFAFIVGGSSLSGFISEMTNISYVEVRPSFSATMDVTRGVYGENAFTGIGTNKFSDAWRLYKDTSINQTVFWNTSFNSGVGYLPTFAVTSGIVGALAWVMFLLTVLFAGLRILLTASETDRFWYYMGTSSFVSALYLWGISCLYVPSPSIILLAALFTGILFTSYVVITRPRSFTISFGNNRRAGFALVLITMIVIIGSVSAVYVVSKQYGGQFAFNKAVTTISPGASIEQIEQNIISAYRLSNDDRFVREITSLQLAKMNSLLALQEPTEEQIQQYITARDRAIEAGNLGVSLDDTEATNWQTLAAVYSLLITPENEELYTRTRQALETATLLDPKNPEIKLQFAQMESRAGNLEAARAFALEAIQLKNNYSEAYLFVAQIDIARGDVEAAIQSAAAIATLEPRNPARHYQLGVLYASQNQPEEAARSFERAVALNESYANARYFLALTYSQLGRLDEAKAQLEMVRDLNPENEAVQSLIQQLENGTPITQAPNAAPIQQNETQTVDGTSLNAEEVPDSPLLAPVNTVPEESDESETVASETELDSESADEVEESSDNTSL